MKNLFNLFRTLFDIAVWLISFGNTKITTVSGNQIWFKRFKKHRDNGPAIIQADGSFAWFQWDKFHRIGGPAIILNDKYPIEYWYRDGELHRLDGPAIKHHRPGEKRNTSYDKFYINGERYSESDFYDTETTKMREEMAMIENLNQIFESEK